MNLNFSCGLCPFRTNNRAFFNEHLVKNHNQELNAGERVFANEAGKISFSIYKIRSNRSVIRY